MPSQLLKNISDTLIERDSLSPQALIRKTVEIPFHIVDAVRETLSKCCAVCGTEVYDSAALCAGCAMVAAPDPAVVPSHEWRLDRGAAATQSVIAARSKRRRRWFLSLAAVALEILLLGQLLLAFSSEIGRAGLRVGVVFATLPVPLYVAIALWVDRYEKEPVGMLLTSFVWGATGAVFFSYLVNTAVYRVAGERLTLIVSPPVVEEVSKGFALLLLYWWKKDEFDNVIDGIVYAAMVGLGFAMVENFLYYGRSYVEGGVMGSMNTFIFRGVISPFAHPLFTSMLGISLGLMRQFHGSSLRIVLPISGLLAAILLHSVANALVTEISPVARFFFFLPVVFGMLLFISYAWRREGHIVRRHLSRELRRGLLVQKEYDSLSSVRARLSASLGALSKGGLDSWRAYSRFSQAATELAFHRDRVARGLLHEDRQAARLESAYVERMRETRRQWRMHA